MWGRGMSFIVAGCVLLMAMLAGVLFDDSGVRRWHEQHKERSWRG
jgi:hypothetical protein